MIEEPTTWKGHTFTLLVFTGIVVLCSIFFILGMLVGRQQGQKFASVAAAATKSEAKAAPKDDKLDFTFNDSVKKQDSAALQPPPKPVPTPDPDPEPITPAPAPAPVETVAAAPPPSSVFNYQIGAVRKSADADKLLEQVKKKGFKAFILAPPEGDPNPFFRIQVGPFSDPIDAQDAKKKLEAAGYQPILKK